MILEGSNFRLLHPRAISKRKIPKYKKSYKYKTSSKIACHPLPVSIATHRRVKAFGTFPTALAADRSLLIELLGSEASSVNRKDA